jgi:hypothetical protein
LHYEEGEKKKKPTKKNKKKTKRGKKEREKRLKFLRGKSADSQPTLSIRCQAPGY